MATFTFHRHFRQVTTLSPLQLQERLRLYEAHRSMLVGNEDATVAGMMVGYESPTQFTREYKRMFGATTQPCEPSEVAPSADVIQ